MKPAQKVRRLLRLLATALFPKYATRKWLKRTKEDSEIGYLSQSNSTLNELVWNNVSLKSGDLVLEVGSNCGNRFLAKASDNPDVTFVGIDVNGRAIELGIESSRLMGLRNVHFHTMSAENIGQLREFYPNGFDFIFTWATLIYVHPSRISKVVKNIISLANREIMFIEQHTPKLRFWPLFLGVPVQGGPNFIREYKILITKFSNKLHCKTQVSVTRVPLEFWNPGGGNGHMILASKES
jgi:hypothetical protein